MLNVHQCGHLVIRNTRHWWESAASFHEDDSGAFQAATVWKTFGTLDFWSLEERHNRADLIEVFKTVKGLSGIPMESMFELFATKHLRGHELKLSKHRSKLEVRRHFFTERLFNREKFWSSYSERKYHGLQRLKQSRMGFFEDWSPTNPMAAQVLQQDWCGTGHTR